MVTGYGSNTFGGGRLALYLPHDGRETRKVLRAGRAWNHTGFEIVSGLFNVLYLRHRTLG
jgi:hypothetical protein